MPPVILLRLLCCRLQQCICYYVHLEANSGYDSFMMYFLLLTTPDLMPRQVPFCSKTIFRITGAFVLLESQLTVKGSCTWTIINSEFPKRTFRTLAVLLKTSGTLGAVNCAALGSDAAHHHRRLHMTKDSSGFLLGHLSSISAIAHVTDGVSLISCGIANR